MERRSYLGQMLASGVQRTSRLKYQPLKLVKEMTVRADESGKSFNGLKKAYGIQPLPGTDRIRPGVLTELCKNCEFLIVVAMYNEQPLEVVNTLTGIIHNLKYFREYGVSPDKIGCIVICDGITPFLKTVKEAPKDDHDPTTFTNREFFSQYFDETMIAEYFNVKNIEKDISEIVKKNLQTEKDSSPEICHCFEQQVSHKDSEEVLNLVWAVKHENLRKLNTHLWFFGGFCEYINPKFVMLLDVGTKPKPDALFRLYEAMILDTSIAGCCGEIEPMKPKCSNMVEGAQVVEYKFAHLFDKALESVIGYITVLPGAFSAYRYEALLGKPLWNDYFKSLCHPELMNAYYSNIYLAEDRVLCLALVSCQEKSYKLSYIRESVAETDIPDDFFKLLAQRRRWINGSWFALIDTIRNRNRINKSGHTITKKVYLWCLMSYYALNVLFSWFMVGSFFLAMAVMTRKLSYTISDRTGISYSYSYAIYSAFVLGYLMILMVNFFLAIGVKPHMVPWAYRWLPRVFAFYMLFIVALTIIYALDNSFSQSWAPWLVVASIGSFIVTPILYGQLKIFKYAISFLLMTRTYINIFITYAMCNIHDCTWGNRPDQLKGEEIERAEEFKSFRAKWVIVWVLCNAAFAYFLNIIDKDNSKENDSSSYGQSGYIYIYVIVVYSVMLLALRFTFSMVFLVQTTLLTKHLPKDVVDLPRARGTPTEVSLYKPAGAPASPPQSTIDGRPESTGTSPSQNPLHIAMPGTGVIAPKAANLYPDLTGEPESPNTSISPNQNIYLEIDDPDATPQAIYPHPEASSYSRSCSSESSHSGSESSHSDSDSSH